MIHQEDDIKWFESLDEAKKEGYVPVKATSVLCFYALKGRTSVLSKGNIEVIRYLQYTIYSPAEKRFYMRLFRAYPLDDLYFYRRTLTFSGESEVIKNLRKYVEDGNVTILFTKEQVEDTKTMLKRLWKANLEGEGQLDYRYYIRILDMSLKLEDYKDYGKNLTGFKTVCNSMEIKIKELWESAYSLKKNKQT